MFEFAHPWLLVLLPLPLLLRKWLPSHREPRTAVSVPFMERLARLTGREPAPGAAIAVGPLVQRIAVVIAWIGIITALARPQRIEDPITKTLPTRDLLLAVDLSGSMEVEDFTDASGKTVNRLTAVKQVLDEFLARREGDRVGLIFFGNAPYVQAPFTEDLDVCRTLLDEAQVRMAGPQTMMGDAVGLAINVFEHSETEERVLIVLTDGNDTGSQVPPLEAAGIARDKDITVHAVAVGDPKAAGEEKLDEETLKAIADATGGGYFHAADREELEDIYKRLDEMDTREAETLSHRPRTDLFLWPLLVFLAAVILSHIIRLAAALSRESRNLQAVSGGAVALISGALAAWILSIFQPGEFHFLRPAWLYALSPLALLFWIIVRRQDARRAWQGVIDEHLLDHLVTEAAGGSRIRPWHLLATVTSLVVIALAGPTWSREPSPFAEDRAALFIVMKATPSMKVEDIQPTRLQRAAHKVRDLLALRQGALTGLIAYSGSAHLVMPLTRDRNIVETFAAELSPMIMPIEGDALSDAIALAAERLDESGLAGSIVVMADSVAAGSLDDLRAAKNRYPVHLLAMTAGEEASLGEADNILSGTLTRVTADESDVERLASRVERAMTAAAEPGEERWKDFGYLLVPLITLLSLLWFRPGWVITYS